MSAFVWLAETIDYPEEVLFCGVWSSPDAAYEGIKTNHVSGPTVVEWLGLHRDDDFGDEYRAKARVRFSGRPDWTYTKEWRIYPAEIDRYPTY